MSGNGIYVLPAEELLANGELSPIFYNLDSGFSCTATANSYSELTAEGDLYIAATTGISHVNIEKTLEDVSDLKAGVPYIEADGAAIYPDGNGAFTIPASTQKLTVFGFVYHFSLSNPQVSYRLEGFERQITTVSRSDLVPADYTNLRGGTYRFVMRLKDAMGRSKYISSSGLRLLLWLEQKMEDEGGEVQVINANQTVLKIFEMAGFMAVLNVITD